MVEVEAVKKLYKDGQPDIVIDHKAGACGVNIFGVVQNNVEVATDNNH